MWWFSFVLSQFWVRYKNVQWSIAVHHSRNSSFCFVTPKPLFSDHFGIVRLQVGIVLFPLTPTNVQGICLRLPPLGVPRGCRVTTFLSLFPSRDGKKSDCPTGPRPGLVQWSRRRPLSLRYPPQDGSEVELHHRGVGILRSTSVKVSSSQVISPTQTLLLVFSHRCFILFRTKYFCRIYSHIVPFPSSDHPLSFLGGVTLPRCFGFLRLPQQILETPWGRRTDPTGSLFPPLVLTPPVVTP